MSGVWLNVETKSIFNTLLFVRLGNALHSIADFFDGATRIEFTKIEM